MFIALGEFSADKLELLPCWVQAWTSEREEGYTEARLGRCEHFLENHGGPRSTVNVCVCVRARAHACVHVCVRSVVSDSLQPHAVVALQAPLFMGFPRQEYWRGSPFPPPRDLPDYVSCIGRWILYGWATGEAIESLYQVCVQIFALKSGWRMNWRRLYFCCKQV